MARRLGEIDGVGLRHPDDVLADLTTLRTHLPEGAELDRTAFDRTSIDGLVA